ncbi:MAG TPA: AraC family transcriptional regulator [Candidatus Acidoferrum sp.]
MGTGASQLKNLSEPSEPVSDYREFLPPVALRERVLCLWTQSIRPSQTVYAHRVLPDACVDLVFFQGQPPAVIGPWTEAFVAQLAPGTRITGARFRPGKAADVLRLPASELLNQQTPIADVWNMAARAPFAGVGEQPTFRATRFALETALSRHLRNATASDAEVTAGIQWLARHPGGRMGQLSRFVGISSRQMQRRFSAAVGYGPKTFQSVLRFQRLLFLASNGVGQLDLADLAARTGYADQSHMTREVQRFAGKPPREMLSSAGCALRLADFLAPSGVGEFADFAA